MAKAGVGGIFPIAQTEIQELLASFPSHHSFKVLINGDPGVGRSALIKRYVCDTFPEEYQPNRGGVLNSIIYYKFLHLYGENICLKIWDVVSNPIDFRTSASNYWRGSSAVIIVFDLSSIESYQNNKNWLIDIDRYCTNLPLKMLIGNKSDKGERVVSYDHMKEMCEGVDVEYYETSAKSSNNVEEVFAHLALLLLKNKKAQLQNARQ